MQIKNRDIDIGLYLGFLFLNTSFYFLDPTVYIPKLAIVASWWLLLGIIAWRSEFRFHPIFIPVLCYFILLQISKINGLAFFGNLQDLLYPIGFVQIFFLLYFLNADKQIALESIDKYITIVTVISLPSILFYLALIFNIDCNYSLIALGGRTGSLYRNYYHLGIIDDWQILSFGRFTIARLCGMFEEPGMLGTYVGLLLSADLILFSGKTLRKVALLVLGLFSLSLTFYIFIIFYLAFIFMKWHFKRFALYSLLVIAIGMMAIPADIKDAFNMLILGRFAITEEGWQGDSAKIEFGQRYAKYLESATTAELAFGHGARSNLLSPDAYFSDYHGTIYEGGYIGLALVLLFSGYFLVWLPLKNEDYLMLLLTLPCLLSLYHRPDFFAPKFLVLYEVVILQTKQWSGAASLELKPNELSGAIYDKSL